MGRTARRPGPPSFLFGVWGEGETSPENIDALLSEFIEGLGDVTPRFLIPLDKEITTDTHIDIANWAIDNKYAVEVIEAAPVRTKALREIKQEADKVHPADDDKNPIATVFTEAVIAKGENARLLFLWAEVDGEPVEDDQRVLADVYDGGVACLDMTQGLDVLAFGDDEGGEEGSDAEPEAASDDPDEATVRDWTIRRVRTYAKTIAERRAEAGEKDVPTDEELDELDKEGLFDFLYPEAAAPEPEKPKGRTRRTSKSTEPEPEPDGEKGFTRDRARQVREEVEKERAGGGRRGAQQPEDGAEEPAEGDGTPGDGVERLRDALMTITLAITEQDEDAENEAWVEFADAFADVVIDRIAARVEKEPEGSAIRKEVAPPRPPGKPRKDGATPTRRRTRA